MNRTAALEALDRALYLLDRGARPAAKVRAFARARSTIADLDDADFARRASSGTWEELAGIGPSTAAVVAAAVTGAPPSYLTRLDADTRVEAGEGAALLAALRGDLHTHSTWSDGGAEIEEMALAASALGRDYLVVTDHSPRLRVARGLSRERLADQVAQIAVLNLMLAPFRILSGVEVDILPDGSLDLPDEILADLDLVVASVHSRLAQPAVDMTARLVKAASNPHVDVLGHPTGRMIGTRPRPPSEFDADLVFATCARFDTAVEVNCRPERVDPPDELLAMARSWGCKVAVNSDAHAPGQLEWVGWGCARAVAAGFDRSAVVNCWSAEDLVAWAGSHPNR